MPQKPRPLADRFWEKVKKGDGCWEWTAATSRGYGTFNLGRRQGTRGAHVVAYELKVGPTEGGFVLHQCDNPACVRPDHLFLGTNADNMRDMSSKGRSASQKKTACPAGHPYSEENTYFDTTGRRRCKPCRRLRRRVQRTPVEQQVMRSRMGAPRRARTHCPQGHEYTEENTYVTPKGSRSCRACQRGRKERTR